MPELIDSKELGLMLSMCPRSASAWVAKQGVKSIDVGLGKRRHLRWRSADVIAMLSTVSDVESKPRPAISRQDTVVGYSLDAIMERLAVTQ